jgi:hypothetical protein
MDFTAQVHACGQLALVHHGPMLQETWSGIVRMGPDRAA